MLVRRQISHEELNVRQLRELGLVNESGEHLDEVHGVLEVQDFLALQKAECFLAEIQGNRGLDLDRHVASLEDRFGKLVAVGEILELDLLPDIETIHTLTEVGLEPGGIEFVSGAHDLHESAGIQAEEEVEKNLFSGKKVLRQDRHEVLVGTRFGSGLDGGRRGSDDRSDHFRRIEAFDEWGD